MADGPLTEIGVLGHRVQSHVVEGLSLEINIGYALTRNRNMVGVTVLVVHLKLHHFHVTFHHVQVSKPGENSTTLRTDDKIRDR